MLLVTERADVEARRRSDIDYSRPASTPARGTIIFNDLLGHRPSLDGAAFVVGWVLGA
jgi:hypothetical protein